VFWLLQLSAIRQLNAAAEADSDKRHVIEKRSVMFSHLSINHHHHQFIIIIVVVVVIVIIIFIRLIIKS